jgi:hypothetical protein
MTSIRDRKMDEVMVMAWFRIKCRVMARANVKYVIMLCFRARSITMLNLCLRLRSRLGLRFV